VGFGGDGKRLQGKMDMLTYLVVWCSLRRDEECEGREKMEMSRDEMDETNTPNYERAVLDDNEKDGEGEDERLGGVD
jgi:hypothetical protein